MWLGRTGLYVFWCCVNKTVDFSKFSKNFFYSEQIVKGKKLNFKYRVTGITCINQVMNKNQRCQATGGNQVRY